MNHPPPAQAMPSMHHSHPEAEERQAVDSAPATATATAVLWKEGKMWSTYPQGVKDMIIRCADLQQRLGQEGALGRNWSDRDFTAGLGIAGKWPALRAGVYPYPSQTKTRTQLDENLRELLSHGQNTHLMANDESRKLSLAGKHQWVELPDYEAIRLAIQASRDKVGTGSEERLVVFRARTRGGKTWLANQLIRESKVNWKVEASPSWKSSYKAMLLCLAELTGASTGRRTVVELESAVLKHLKTLAGTLLFEEVQSLCASSQEFIKLILNQTNLTVCIFITNEAHDELLCRGGNALAQLFARAEASIPAAPITADTVRLFAPALYSRATAEQLNRIAQAANDLGALSAVRRITDSIQADAKGNGAVTDASVREAIEHYRSAVPLIKTTRALFGRSPSSTRKAA